MSALSTIAELAGILNDVAAKLKPLGMLTGYHAHPFDFVRFGDETAWEILFSSTSQDVVMQMDIGNCAGGDGDPIPPGVRHPDQDARPGIDQSRHPDGPCRFLKAPAKLPKEYSWDL